MSTEQSVPRQVRYAQGIIAVMMLYDMINSTYQVFHHNGLIILISYTVTLVLLFFWIFLTWQLGRLRWWARNILLVLLSIRIISLAVAVLYSLNSMTSRAYMLIDSDSGTIISSPSRSSTFSLYQIYSIGIPIIFLALCILVFYYLTRPIVRSACNAVRRKRDASDVSGQQP